MVVVITDGQSNEPAVTKEEAMALKASGVSVFAIGVGQKVDFEELRAIGSQPSSTHVLTTPDHKALASLEHFLDVHQCERNILILSVVWLTHAYRLRMAVMHVRRLKCPSPVHECIRQFHAQP
jgi:hypothetical protein